MVGIYLTDVLAIRFLLTLISHTHGFFTSSAPSPDMSEFDSDIFHAPEALPSYQLSLAHSIGPMLLGSFVSYM